MTPLGTFTAPVIRRLQFGQTRPDPSLEWLVTNGLGGYASAPVAGGMTRRYHGVLIAALAAPHGRIVMVNHVRATLLAGDRRILLDHENQQTWTEQTHGPAARLVEFRLESGLPVWEFEAGDTRVEKRLMMPHLQNTTQMSFRRLAGTAPLSLELRPMFHVRPHEEALSESAPRHGRVTMTAAGAELELASGLPAVRLIASRSGQFKLDEQTNYPVEYIEEKARGYHDKGDVWGPGPITFDMNSDEPVTLVASTESWETLGALIFESALQAECARRAHLIAQAIPAAQSGIAAELTIAADQFIITPATRTHETVLAKAAGVEPRTVIAGYHWFTDWGRDTMISLEGLTITTGRAHEAGAILRLFAGHVKDGLIPNLFPEGERSGLYHTADATLWFFHALDRYISATNDRATLGELLPTMIDIVDHHIKGTRFGIGVDKQDGLLHQGAEGYQLTWMDAKVDGWVVTPRRGKAVEINALWHAALLLLASWLEQENRAADSRRFVELADQARESFNRRFWNPDTGYLFDVVDGEKGDDPACRPNQVFAISLSHPVLDRSRWEPVLEAVRQRLLTPVGLRSLGPGHPDYRPKYYGDLRSRDAAYHQGTVWAWLIGAFVDAWLKVHPDDRAGARACLTGFVPHLDAACVGSVSEIFDAEAPFTPRGCIAQAWSVAELLRSWVRTEPLGS
jgi:predicted glycogen debranching enzyme